MMSTSLFDEHGNFNKTIVQLCSDTTLSGALEKLKSCIEPAIYAMVERSITTDAILYAESDHTFYTIGYHNPEIVTANGISVFVTGFVSLVTRSSGVTLTLAAHTHELK